MIKNNYDQVSKSLNDHTKLIVVSKTRTVDEIQKVVDLGHKDFGENKVQELQEKSQFFKDKNLNWHFIGHLQSNKINQLLSCPSLSSIHSIDRISLLDKLLSKETEHKIGLFLQVNTSGEIEKGGFSNESVDLLNQAVIKIKSSSDFFIQGLMTIGKIRTDDFKADAHTCFKSLVSLKQKLDKTHDLDLELSMGMSQDFEIALEYKTNWVRIGTQIFGPRP